jgi:hypothetical protein
VIYVSTTDVGELTNVEPSSGLSLAIAFVIFSHASTGILFSRPTTLDENAYATAAQGETADSALQDVIDDTTPQLGGNLDLKAFNIEGAVAADLVKLAALTASAVELNYVNGVTSAIQTQLGTKAVKGQTDWLSGFWESPDDKSYTMTLKAPIAGVITETTSIAVSGTCTATFKINTTALGGTANSVSSSESSQAHASANAFSAGDDIVVTISSNSTTVDMALTIKFTYNLV